MSLAELIPFRGRKIELLTDEDIASIADLAIPRPLLDRAAQATEAVLRDAHETVARQDAIIAEATETRRQALVVIEAFEPAQKHLVDGIDPPEPVRKGRKPVLQAAE